MRKRKILSLFAGFLFLAGLGFSVCHGISNEPVVEAKADTTVDLGTVSFILNTGTNEAKTKTGIYLIADPNACPYPEPGGDWNMKFYSDDSNAVLRNGSPICSPSMPLDKCGEQAYYLGLSGGGYGTRVRNEKIVLQGTWSFNDNGTIYTLTARRIELQWNGTKWTQLFVVPDLEPYDKISLAQIGQDDINCESVDGEGNPSSWNTYVVSEDNTTKSFSFEFEFEAFDKMTDSVNIRVGNTAAYDVGHFYSFVFNNNEWGTGGVGAAILREFNDGVQVGTSGDVVMNLQPGTRHTIEFGSIYVLDSTNEVYEFVKYDGNVLYQKVKAPYNNERTNKIGIYTSTENVYIGNTIAQKENTDTLALDNAYGIRGLYLTGSENDVPIQDWSVRGAPTSKYNALKNGEPMYPYGLDPAPLVKTDTYSYYLAFNDAQLEFNEGDVVSIDNEYHFYHQGRTYAMAIQPVSFLYTNKDFTQIEALSSYLYNELDSRVDPELYDDAGLLIIENIMSDAMSSLTYGKTNKELWDTYYDLLERLEAVPYDEEKAQRVLQEARERAFLELNNYYDETNYEEAELEVIQGYINDAMANIGVATTIAAINRLVAQTKALIDAVPTKQQAIEQKILSLVEGYEDYLKEYDVATTTDLNAIGELEFHSDSEGTYSSGALTDFSARIATSSNNKDGNMVFQFKYRSTDPSSSRHGAQIYIRLRGTDSNCYRFAIGTSVDTGYGVSIATLVNDVVPLTTLMNYNANFVSNQSYDIECGCIDLKDYNRTFMFIKIDGEFVLKNIVDSVNVELAPTVRIMDSYTAEHSDAVAYMSPLEEGTTKEGNATLIGRLVLDPESDNANLKLTLRKNNIPVGSLLRPMEEGAFLVNGHEVDSYRPNTYVRKDGLTTYTVCFDYESLVDGSEVRLKGIYSTFDEVEAFKQVYTLFDVSFTYDADSNSWTQADQTLEVAKIEAQAMLRDYVDLSNYSDANANIISGYINSYCDRIENAVSVEQVEQLLNEALALIDAVPTKLEDYKEAAKNELRSYRSPDEYREEERAELETILSEAFTNIDNSSDEASIDLIVRDAKAQIDTLKTKAERDAEDLASQKKVAKAEVEHYVGLLDMDRYSDADIELINSLAFSARQAIDDATSIDEVNAIVAKFKKDINNIQTVDGFYFNGETYVKPAPKTTTPVWLIPVIIGAGVLLVGAAIAVVLIIVKKKH